MSDEADRVWSLSWFIERAERIAARAAGAHERERARCAARANPPDLVDETWAQYAAAWRAAAELARDLRDVVEADNVVKRDGARKMARAELARRLLEAWQAARHAGAQGRWWAFFEAYEWAREE